MVTRVGLIMQQVDPVDGEGVDAEDERKSPV
jgi:hypothetical protein